ncbi:hypothetical protein Tco_1559581 [Tanacetum coccineum]
MEEDHAGSNPRQSHVVQARPNPKLMHEDFMATIYPQVHESLKLTTDDHVHIENPPSSSGTLSSMKNLGDAFTFGDQFLNDKPSKEEPCKANVETEVESMVTVPIHQASSSKQLTTITLPPPPPPPQQRTTDPDLATLVFALEKICANFKKKSKLQDKTTQALSSRVYTLENHDLDLSEFEMKEILRNRMFESGSYISHPEHTTLYDAPTSNSRKRHRDGQDPPPPPQKDSDQSKKKRHDSNASASKQPLIQKSLA